MIRTNGPGRKRRRIWIDVREAAPVDGGETPPEQAASDLDEHSRPEQRARDRRAREGRWNSAIPLGYRLNADGDLVADHHEAWFVRDEMFEKLVELGSAGRLVRHPNSFGKGPDRDAEDGPFTKPRTKRILQNPVYIGKVLWKGNVYEGRHPAIIPEDLFENVQRILESNVERNHNYNASEGTFLLRDLLRCRCGAAMWTKTSTSTRGRNLYYRSPNRECHVKYLNAEDLESAILGHLGIEPHPLRARQDLRQEIIR